MNIKSIRIKQYFVIYTQLYCNRAQMVYTHQTVVSNELHSFGLSTRYVAFFNKNVTMAQTRNHISVETSEYRTSCISVYGDSWSEKHPTSNETIN